MTVDNGGIDSDLLDENVDIFDIQAIVVGISRQLAEVGSTSIHLDFHIDLINQVSGHGEQVVKYGPL